MYLVEISYTKTVDYTWSGDFSELPEELRALVTDTVGDVDSHDPDDLADVISAKTTDVDMFIMDDHADLQSESYEVDTVTVS